MDTQITPDARSSSNVWIRRAALRAAPPAPVKEANIATLSESEPQTSKSELKPVNLAPVLEAVAETDFEVVGAKGLAATQARMQRQTLKAAQPRAPRVTLPKELPKPRVIAPLPANPRPLGPRVLVQGIVAAPAAAAAAAAPAPAPAPAPAVREPNTYTVTFGDKVTMGLTFDRLHKATKVDLFKAQETLYNHCITAFEYALENDGLLQCIDHISGGFQTRKFVAGVPIVAGNHTFLASDIIKDHVWVRKTRNTLNGIEPRLRVNFYFDHNTTKVVMSLKKA